MKTTKLLYQSPQTEVMYILLENPVLGVSKGITVNDEPDTSPIPTGD